MTMLFAPRPRTHKTSALLSSLRLLPCFSPTEPFTPLAQPPHPLHMDHTHTTHTSASPTRYASHTHSTQHTAHSTQHTSTVLTTDIHTHLFFSNAAAGEQFRSQTKTYGFLFLSSSPAPLPRARTRPPQSGWPHHHHPSLTPQQAPPRSTHTCVRARVCNPSPILSCFGRASSSFFAWRKKQQSLSTRHTHQ